MAESLGDCRVCGGEASTSYPLLPGGPAFCSDHHNEKDAGPFGADFSGPDDFDIPVCDNDEPWDEPRLFDKKNFVWTDRDGEKHKLTDIDDVYLTNIVRFLGRSLDSIPGFAKVYFTEVREFLVEEATKRGLGELVS
ncbi:hypothetical protein LCGC14_2699590 [marine sediment metagenome]|uniref:Uncharacterized protein n=1 Tax=marine sediment metagenome TaxID=412755 RepID=A0A0F8ZG17_9ZZZZ